MTWDWGHWSKNINWKDPDTAQLTSPNGGISVGQSGTRYFIEDKHTMFALRANTSPFAALLFFTIEPGLHTERLKIKKSKFVYVGNGFLYWETDDEYKDPESKST